MTRNELVEELHIVIQTIVQQSGGEWKKSYRREVDHIFALFGKLSPERDGNIKEVVPDYNKHLIKKVGRVKMQFTPNEMANAKAILRKMGMI